MYQTNAWGAYTILTETAEMSTGRPLGRKAGIAPGTAGGAAAVERAFGPPHCPGAEPSAPGLAGAAPQRRRPCAAPTSPLPKGSGAPGDDGTARPKGRRERRPAGGAAAVWRACRPAKPPGNGPQAPFPGLRALRARRPPPRAAGRSPAQNLSLPDEQEGAPPGALGACWNGAAKNQGIPHGVCPQLVEKPLANGRSRPF